MQKTILLLLVLLFPFVLSSQTLEGVVYDMETRNPLSEVHVYLDGTSVYATTDVDGKFKLYMENPIDADMVFSHVSYDMYIIKDPFNSKVDKVYLSKKNNVLEEVTVMLDPFTYEEKLEAFREQFLGDTKAGHSCKIQNEKDLKFYYDLNEKIFYISSDYPLVIENEYLGYKILYMLVDFQIKYKEISLNKGKINEIFMLGSSSFVDEMPNVSKIKKRRDDIYKKSSQYFFKLFTTKGIQGSNFAVYTNGDTINPNHYFSIEDTLTYKRVSIKPDTDIQTFLQIGRKRACGFVSVLYRNGLQSDITFFTDSFLVNDYGMILEYDKVFFAGYMGDQRVGNMLPLEYSLKKKKKKVQ
ncbi:carboxypeptidase-like regulatory domain-containing protein [Porphyromonadaceae bacterium OttesenSCG-928-L07]|nr:carboxypeptidase-like regulatory domain-containing protein [Porphyromonadaceae bacterium OttesenSCG-928-L07]MDL2251355.1 carboxypeptidase-like regulatory domain-containing protein [Odoribacter sp. OttesenSCG-928-J03]MDL2283238.1 carboxypeptidase-like regulatory domain-containing protein [Odoribacter sp. OttesenSCG-928-G04]